MEWSAQYIGIPFAADGASRAGANCWGLVHLVLKEQCGIATPTYDAISADELIAAARQFRTSAVAEPWIRVTTQPRRAFDVVLMHAMASEDGGGRSRVPGHVGILIDASRLLHVWEKCDAVVMSLDHPRIRHRIVDFYRHRELT